MTELHVSLRGIPTPERVKRLPLDARGFYTPAFVATLPDGTRDFRIVDPAYMTHCVRNRRCWICGDKLGVRMAFVLGCMCAVNRVISEPPSHRECAAYAARACPFLARPNMVRREAGMPDTPLQDAAGFGIKRNPGVCAVWVTRSYKPFRAHHGNEGVLFRIGDPEDVTWWREGRPATQREVLSAIVEGLPALAQQADQQETDDPGCGAVAALHEAVMRVRNLLPPPIAEEVAQ
jgi:hypothetical protein